MKKSRSLKLRITFWVAIVLFVCSALIILFDQISCNVKNRFSDQFMINVFNDVRLENEKFHIKRTNDALQTFAGSDEVIEFLEGDREKAKKTVIEGLFITLSESIKINKLVLLDKNYSVVFSNQGKNALAKESAFTSQGMKKLYDKSAETWENQAACIESGGKVVFIIATVVINDDDDVLGIAAGELPVKELATSFAKIVKGHIGFQGPDLTFAGTCDNNFFAQIPSKKVKESISDSSFVLELDNVCNKEPPENQAESLSGEKGEIGKAQPRRLSYKIYPIEVEDINKNPSGTGWFLIIQPRPG